MYTPYLAVLLFILAMWSATIFSTEELAPPLISENEESAESNLQSSDELPEAEVTIIKRGEDHIEEYRMGGHLYMIKITPSSGPVYYLIDTDGDGNLETRQNGMEPNFLTSMWLLFSW